MDNIALEMALVIETRRTEPAIELAVVIPTYNERENILTLLAALEETLSGTEWEAVFVDDDSPDGTAEFIRAVAATNRRVRIMQRIGRRGLSSACIEGMLATSAQYIAVMDGDLQHDERALPKMLERMKSEDLDIVVASRNVAGGSMGQTSRRRIWLSSVGTRISRLINRYDISDVMSGFFLVSRAYFQQVVHRLTGAGFKILLDLLASGRRPIRIGEVPYHFRQRQWGESKLDVNAALEHVYLLADKIIGQLVPTRFVLFVSVGSLHFLVHLIVLALIYYKMNANFVISQTIATFVAMTFTFLSNNAATFRDRRLCGSQLVTGLLTFYTACSLGTLINVSFAEFLVRSGITWYLAGISGMAVSSAWNYGVNTILTWRRCRVPV